MNAPGSAELRLQVVDRLINIGQWDEALAPAEENVWDPALAKMARAWFQLALVAGLLGRHEQRSEAATRARECADFTDQMDGDMRRDDAIASLIEGKTDRAWLLCETALERHADDPNRQAALYMVFGRIRTREGEPRLALHCHRIADETWQRIGDQADRQWVTNNLLH